MEEAIRRRRTVRRFKPYKMPREHLVKILEAARLAPSAGNAQPWMFIVVEDDAVKRELAQATAHGFLAEASVIIAVLGNAKLAGGGGGSPRREWLDFDIAIAIEHMVLQATGLGLATCWDVSYWENGVKRILKVPEQLLPGGWSVKALLPIGLAGETPPSQERKPLSDLVYLDRWGNPFPGLRP
ncbi:MAG: nitroreductase family protein [Candidatus Bathyarchaeia archaeon]